MYYCTISFNSGRLLWSLPLNFGMAKKNTLDLMNGVAGIEVAHEA
jgi:hypothetical protein